MTRETYRSAGVNYPITDLWGYPDTLIRSRVSVAYSAGCGLIKENRLETGRVMDLGSCHGHGVERIKQELIPRMLLSADRWHDFLSIQRRVIEDTHGMISYINLNSPFFPVKDGCLDGLFVMHMIEHLNSPAIMLKEADRVLKKEGWLLVATPNRKNLVAKNPDDEHVFTAHELTDILMFSGRSVNIFYVNANQRAMTTHERKKRLSVDFPITGELRKKINWRIWDKFVLRGNLTVNDFCVSTVESENSIDLLALVY